MRNKLRKTGFTLLELIVALVIGSIIVGALYGSLHSGHKAQEKGQQQSEMFQVARMALDIITHDLRSIVSSGSSYDTGLTGIDGVSGEKNCDDLKFMTESNFPKAAGEIDLIEVEYFIDDDPRTVNQGLQRKVKTLLTGIYQDESEICEIQELSPEITELDFEYFDGSAWQSDWDSSTQEKMPVAIQVSLTVTLQATTGEISEAIETESEFFQTIIYLPMGSSENTDEKK